MPELHFSIEGAEAVANAAAPLIALKLRITNLPATEAIHTLTLRCQVQIEPARRSYVPGNASSCSTSLANRNDGAELSGRFSG